LQSDQVEVTTGVVKVTASRSVELSEEESRIVRFLCEDRDEHPTTVQIATDLQKGEQRTLYHLERLEEQKLIMRAMSTIRPTEWFLTQKGRVRSKDEGFI
jgi:hypothetical protein